MVLYIKDKPKLLSYQIKDERNYSIVNPILNQICGQSIQYYTGSRSFESIQLYKNGYFHTSYPKKCGLHLNENILDWLIETEFIHKRAGALNPGRVHGLTPGRFK